MTAAPPTKNRHYRDTPPEIKAFWRAVLDFDHGALWWADEEPVGITFAVISKHSVQAWHRPLLSVELRLEALRLIAELKLPMTACTDESSVLVLAPVH